jgi:hypothetical protein
LQASKEVAQDAGVPISKETMVTTRTKCALKCGNMMLVWREWKHQPALNHMWNNWKLHWMAAIIEMKEDHLTGWSLCQSNHSGDGTGGENGAITQQLSKCIQAKNYTVKKLVATNEQ